jgi:hypothetical protein
MLNSSNDLLYAVKLHLAANRRCSGCDERSVPSVVRRDSDDGQQRMCGATLTNKLFALTVIEIVVGENQIKTTGCQRTPSRRKTGNDRDAVRAQKLSRDLLGEDGVIFKVEDVHERMLGGICLMSVQSPYPTPNGNAKPRER